jgi:hypothetical protein
MLSVDGGEDDGGTGANADPLLANTPTIVLLPHGPMATTHVMQSASPFPHRLNPIAFSPIDRPCDDDPEAKNAAAYAIPIPMPASSIVPARQRRIAKKGKNANLLVCMSDGAVKFSGLMHCLAKAGFTITDAVASASWSLRWCKRVEPEEYTAMRPHQKINHFPGTWGIGRKDNLHRRMTALAQHYGRAKYGFVPVGFLLPAEARSFELDYNQQLAALQQDDTDAGGAAQQQRRARPLYIVKQVASACGRGMRVISRVPKKWKTCLVQRYIDDPLLVKLRKFDLRIYVAVTSYNPLRIYIYREGLCRFASSPYPVGKRADVTNKTAHLTNFCLNRVTKDFVMPQGVTADLGGASSADATLDAEEDDTADDANDRGSDDDDDDDDDGADAPTSPRSPAREGGDRGAYVPAGEDPSSKWTFGMLKDYFQRHGMAHEWEPAWRRIDDVIIRTLLCVEGEVATQLSKLMADPKRSSSGFELYGFDVLLRSDFSPVLMEVNIMPSLGTTCSVLDQHVKANMIADLLTLAGVQAPGKRHRRRPASLQNAFLDRLTEEELAVLCQGEEEAHRQGAFRRVFPTATAWDEYKNCFDTACPYNSLLAEWEQIKLEGRPLSVFAGDAAFVADAVDGAAAEDNDKEADEEE